MSSAYSPDSNGVAERFNRILLQKSQALLLESWLGPKYWDEAALYESYVMNITPVRDIDGKTAFEMLFCQMPKCQLAEGIWLLCPQSSPDQTMELEAGKKFTG